jgi:prephenate dehydrogenase
MDRINIGIIGGTGGMGRWFETFFSEAGHNVLISGRKTEITYEDVAHDCDVVILSVPLDAAILISKRIGPIMNKDQLLMDFCSLKESILENMLSYTSAQVIGTHPLFGPFTDSIKGQNIIICHGRGAHWLGWLEDEFTKRGAVVTKMDSVTHDKNMAVVQGLTHLLTISLGRTLQKLNISPSDAVLFSTPVFRLKIDLLARLFAQDLGLYASLISKNIYVKDVVDTFLSAIDEGKECLLSGRDDIAISFMESIRGFLGDYCQEGLEESNKVLNALHSGSKSKVRKQ